MCEKLCFMFSHNCDRWDNVCTEITYLYSHKIVIYLSPAILNCLITF